MIFTGSPNPATPRSTNCPLLLSYRTRQKAKRRQVRYTFLFMRAEGDQLRQITSLVDAGRIRPVVGKVVITMR